MLNEHLLCSLTIKDNISNGPVPAKTAILTVTYLTTEVLPQAIDCQSPLPDSWLSHIWQKVVRLQGEVIWHSSFKVAACCAKVCGQELLQGLIGGEAIALFGQGVEAGIDCGSIVQ